MPTPTPILEGRGSWRGKSRAAEPKFEPGTPTCPAFLKGEARAEWRRQAKQLAVAGLVTKADRALLAAYCEAWGEYVEVLIEMATAGRTYTTETGYVGTHPLVAIKHRAVERLVKLADRFGFGPAARARLAGSGAGPEKPKSRLDEFRVA